MTTNIVMSVTDELVAELEAVAHTGKGAFMIECAEVHALLTERAELLRDGGRYRWLRGRIENKGDMVIAKVSEWSIESWSGDDPDSAIDAAMQSEAKP